MPTVVEIPTIGNVEFPDGMTPQQINDVIETEITKTRQPPDPYSGGDPELGRILGPQLDPAEAQRRNEVAQLRQLAREAPFRDIAPIPDLNLIREQRVAEFAAAPPSLRLVSEALDTALDQALDDAATRKAAETTPFASIGKAFGRGAGAAVESVGAGVEAAGRATLSEQPLTEDDVLAARREAAIESLKLRRAPVGGRGFRPSTTVAAAAEPTEAEIEAELRRGSPAQYLAERRMRNRMAEQQDYLRLTGAVNDPMARATARDIKIPAGEFMQEAGESARTSELYADPYHDQTPIAQRLRERPVETVFVEGAKQAPNFILALGSGAFGTRLGVNPYVSAGTTSFVLEKGDIYQEGQEFLIGKYGGKDSVPSQEWVKLNQLANEYGAFNAVLDAVTPGSQVARAMVGKALVQRLLSAEGARYIGKELIKDLIREIPTELAQEESTMRAMEQTGQTLTPEQKLDRRLSVVAGVVLPVGAGSAVSSVSAIQRGKPAATAAQPPAAERPVPTGIQPEAAVISPREASKPEAKPEVSPQPAKAERIPRLPPRVSRETLSPTETTAPEAPQATISPVPVSEGARRVILPDGGEIQARPAIVEADQLIASQLPSGAENPAYPRELQPRDRTRAASQIQIATIAQNLRPELLGDTGKAGDGAPIVGPDNVVESGNARSVAIQRAYGTPKGEEYKRWLIQNARQFGLDPAQIEAMRAPVLVRQRVTPLDAPGRAEFARRANQPEVAPMSPAETARADAARLTDRDIELLRPSEDGDLLAASNQDFLRAFAQRLGNLEAGGLLTADGRWTKQMADRVQSAVFERAYGDRRLTELMAEEADPDIKNILNALNRAAPAFARARADDPRLGDLNAIQPLVDGIELLREAKRRGQSVESMLGQGDLFAGTPERTAAMARFLDANRRRPRQLGEALQRLGERIGAELVNQRSGRLIGEAPTLGELTQAVTREMQEKYGEGAAAQLSLVAEPEARFEPGQDQTARQELEAELVRARDKFEDTGEFTHRDLVDEVESIAAESRDPDAAARLMDAVEIYRDEQQYDFKLGGRGDMESAEEAFNQALEAVIESLRGGAVRTSETVTGVGEESQGAAESSIGRVSTRAEPSSISTTRAASAPTRTGPATSRGKAAISGSITQPNADPVALQGLARQSLLGFRSTLADVARMEGVQLIGARVKEDLGRIREKAETKGFDRLYDYLGGRLSVDNLPAMLRAVGELRQRFDVVRYDDFLELPKNGGYRAVHIDVRLDNGLIAEVQVVPKPLAEIQERFHQIYERNRKTRLAPHELERLRQDLVTMAEAYGKAFDDFMGRRHFEEREFDLRQISEDPQFVLADVGPGQLAFDLAPSVRPEPGAEARLKKRIRAVQVGELRTGITTIRNARDAAHVTASLRKSPQEVMGILVTDAQDKALAFIRIGRGGRGAVSVDTLNLMAALHDIPGAKKVWSVHNHPSGSPFQSGADVQIAHVLEGMLSMQGYEYRGSVVVAHRNTKASIYEPLRPRESEFGRHGFVEPIQPAARRETLPVVETRFRGRPALEQGREIGNSEDLKAELQRLASDRHGLLLLDARHRPLDFIDIGDREFQTFSSDPTAARHVWERIAQSNAVAVALRTSEGNAAIALEFIKKISNFGQLRALDVIAGDKSMSAVGRLATEERGHYSASTFYGGVPVDAVADSVGRAVQRLGDKLGVPVGSTEIVAPEAAKRPGPLSQIVSPNRIAKKYPIFKPVFDRAQVAAETQERLRKVFRDRLQRVDEILGWSATANVPGSPAARRFAENYAKFQEIRLTQDALGKDFTPAELREMFDASPEIIRALRLTRSAYDHALDLANRVRELRGKPGITRREGYVPHFFHEWMIDVDGTLTYSARSLREAIAMTNDLARDGRQIRIRPKTRQFPGESTHAAVLGDRQYFNIQSRLRNNLGIDRADAEALMAELAKRRGRSRFVGNFLRRRGYDGWEQDLRWADRHYFNMVSRFAALDPFKSWSVSYFENKVGGFDKEHRGIEKYMKDFINDVNGNPTHVEDLLNSWIARTPAVGQFLGKYLGDRPALQIAGGITNAVAIAKLGLYNVSSAVVNLTQLMNTHALVGPRSFAAGVARTAAIDAKLAGRALGIQAAERADRDMGILKQAGVDVQLGLESGAGYSRAAQMGRLFRTSTAFFQGVEHNLRRIAVLAGYDKARREGKTHREAIEFAKDINNRSNFEYGIQDAPGFIRRGGPVSQVLFQFKKFPIKQMEFMTSLEGMQHARFWIPFLLMSGYFGFPGVDFLNNAVRQLFDLDLELELKKALLGWIAGGEDDEEKARRRAIAKTIMYGAFAHDQLGGVDLTRRIGGGDFIPSDLSDLWGPFVSSTVRATQLAARDEWADALRAISTAPGNVVIALRNDGEISNPWQRGRLGVRLTPGQQAAKSLGFAPTVESMQRDVSRIAGYETRRFNRQRQELVDDLIRAARLGEAAREAGNAAGERRAEAQIDKIAARAERLQIPLSADIIRREARLKQLTPAQRAWLGASNIIRGRLAPIYEALEPELEEQNAAGAGQ